jgi:hypothetical protein
MRQKNSYWQKADQLVGGLYPVEYRRWISFRVASGFVLFLFAFNVAFKLLAPLPHSLFTLYAGVEQRLRSPLLLGPYNLALAAGAYIVFRSRPHEEHSYLRVLLYVLVLAGIAGEVLLLFIPWRAAQ